jgi:G3E family GTPase
MLLSTAAPAANDLDTPSRSTFRTSARVSLRRGGPADTRATRVRPVTALSTLHSVARATSNRLRPPKLGARTVAATPLLARALLAGVQRSQLGARPIPRKGTTPMTTSRPPATVLTGFLGAGKTTLINRLLDTSPNQKFALIINEFGEIGIDNQLVISEKEEIIELNNGCICCTVRGDLIRSVDQILSRYDNIDHLIIETTGLADPGPVVQSFLVDDRIQSRITLDAVVTVVDCRHFLSQIAEHEAQEQVAFADVVLLNKLDLVEPVVVEHTIKRIRSLNRFARIEKNEDDFSPREKLIGIQAFDLKNILAFDPDFLNDDPHEHDESVSSVAISNVGPVDGVKFNKWIYDFVQNRGPNIFRMKGILDIDSEPRRFVFQGVHMTLEGQPGKAWQKDEVRRNELVLIGRELDQDAIRQGFESCLR